MEILVTIVAFWLVLVGSYGAYTLTRERASAERTPKVRTKRPAVAKVDGSSGPFAPVSLPAEKVPSFITRVGAVAPAAQASVAAKPETDRFAAEKVVAARVAQTQTARAVRDEEPSYDEPRYHAPRYVAPTQPQDAEVSFLRAQVEHLRSEIYALSSESVRKVERPKQRRYRTGNYTALPRTLRRQINEARGFRRFFSS